MLKIKFILLFAVIFFTNLTFLNGQYKLSYFKNNHNDAGISYNFFTGTDAGPFSTTINGFGSGFFFDALTGRYSLGIINLGDKKTNLSLGAGIAINKYRFSNNKFIIEKSGDRIVTSEDSISTHDYGNGFFSNGKSKLVYASVFFPLYFNVTLEKVNFSAGIFVDQYITGKLKRKYRVDGDKTVEIVRNKDFNNFFLNKTKFGIDTSVKHNKSGIGLGFTFMLTPFFDVDHGPTLFEKRVTLTIDLKKAAEKKLPKIDEGVNT